MNRFFRKKNRSFIPVGWGIVSTWEVFPEWRKLLFEESDSSSSYAVEVALRLRADYDAQGHTDWVIGEWTLASLEFEYAFLKKIGSEEIVLRYGVFYLRLPYRSFVDGDLLEEIQPRLEDIDNRSTHGNRPYYYLSIAEVSESSLIMEDDLKIHIGDYESSFEGNGLKNYSLYAHRITLKDMRTLEEFQSKQSANEGPDKSTRKSLSAHKFGWGVFGVMHHALRYDQYGIKTTRIRLTEPGLSYEEACLIKEEFEELRAKGKKLPGQGFYTFDELRVMRDLQPRFTKLR